jgi:hypothetical protein
MSNSHGELFTEIGKLVLAANSGQAIDLNATVKDLSDRYRNLGMTEETMLKVVTRSVGAISYSMTRTNGGLQERLEALRESGGVPLPSNEVKAPAPIATNGASTPAATTEAAAAVAATKPAAAPAATTGRRSRRASAKSAAQPEGGAKGQTPFPSGVRLAVIP